MIRRLLLVIVGTLIGCEAPTAMPVPASRSEGIAARPDDSNSAKAPVLAESWKVGSLGATYYKSSPAQGRPPDGQIAAGTQVEILEDGGVYIRVGWGLESGWIARDDLIRVEQTERQIHYIETH